MDAVYHKWIDKRNDKWTIKSLYNIINIFIFIFKVSIYNIYIYCACIVN